MSIADKYTTLTTEKIPKVYEAGYKKGKAEGGDTTAAYEQGVADGNQAMLSDIWDAIQQGGARTKYNEAFKGVRWNNTIFKPKYDIRPTGGDCTQIFYQSGVTDVKGICERQGITLDFSQVTAASQPLFNSAVTRMPVCDLTKQNAVSTFFHSAKQLEWVDKVILRNDGTQQFGTGLGYHWTLYAGNLVHFPIEGKIGMNVYFGSDKLDDESVQSIVDALMDLTGQTSQNVYFHTNIVSKLTEQQITTITAKNWIIG